MKITIWIDTWPQMDPRYPCMWSAPPSSPPVGGGKRYRAEIEVPDPETIVPVDGMAVVTQEPAEVP